MSMNSTLDTVKEIELGLFLKYKMDVTISVLFAPFRWQEVKAEVPM